MKLELFFWIVFLLLVALSFLFPRARSFSISAVGVAIVAIVAIIVVAKRDAPTVLNHPAPSAVEQEPIDFERFSIDKLDKADPEAKNRIRVEEVRFDQVHAEAGADRGSIGMVVARLYNDSTNYSLTDYGYHLAVQDCIKSVCTTIFEQHGLAAVSVPPNQARDVKIPIQDGRIRNMSPIKILGAANILLTPSATRAQPASNVAVD